MGLPERQRTFAKRFQIVRSLKEGRGMETLLARDLQAGGEVILKVVAARTVSPGTQQRIEHDAAALRDAPADSLVPVASVGQEDGLLFWVTPHLAAESLAERLRQGPLALRDALSVARCVLEALATAHERGVLHRDVKPSNVVLVEDASPLRARLVDFGLARASREAGGGEQLVDAIRYRSPEQAGLYNQPVDERSDLYAAGLVFFECLHGKAPFQAQTVSGLLRQQLALRPPGLRALGVSVPRVVDELVQKLLQKDPRGRYQTAAGAAADLVDLEQCFARGETDPALVLGTHDPRRTLLEPTFVGRQHELGALTRALAEASGGQRPLVLVEGESGGGKTELLDEFAHRSADAGALVLRGFGVGQSAHKPLQILDGIARELLASARLDRGFAGQLRARLLEDREAIAAAMPQLAEILDPLPSAAPGPEAHGDARTLRALAALLDAVGTAERPAVVLLDDVHWSDQLTVRLVERWRNLPPARRGEGHVLVVLAFRTEEVPEEHVLRTLEPTTHLVLQRFDEQDLRALLASMAGPLPPSCVEAVSALSDGSPFLAGAVLQGLVEVGALIADDTGWRLDEPALAAARTSSRSTSFLRHRLQQLPAHCLRLLEVGAVLGKDFDASFAAGLAGLPTAQGLAALNEARRRHLVWADANGTQWAFAHDKVRDGVLAGLWGSDRKKLHLRVAQQLAEEDQDGSPGLRTFEIAYHFDAAGEHDLARPFALQSADAARATYALEAAEAQFRIAARGAEAADAPTQLRIAGGLGDVLMLRGKYAEAHQQFVAALGLSRSNLERATIEGRLGEIAFKRSDTRTAGQATIRALRLLGMRAPVQTWALALQLVWEIGIQVAHTLLPSILVGRRSPESATEALLAVRLYGQLAYLYYFTRGPIATLWAHLRELNLAERYTATPELASAYSKHGPAMILVPLNERAIRYVERSLALRRALGDRWGEGQSLSFLGTSNYSASRFQGALPAFREAVRLLDRMGDRWEANNAGYMTAFCLYQMGDLRAAADVAEGVYRGAVEIGDEMAAGVALDPWAKACGGRIDAALVHRSLAKLRQDNPQALQDVLQAEGVRQLAGGEFTAAAATFAEAEELCAAASLVNTWTGPIPLYRAEALRRAAEALPAGDPARNALLRDAQRALRRGLRLARRFRNQLPMALREQARLAALRGKTGLARRCLDESLERAAQHGARYEHAQTLLARAELGRRLGWPEAQRDKERALVELRESGAAHLLEAESHAPGDSARPPARARFSP